MTARTQTLAALALLLIAGICTAAFLMRRAHLRRDQALVGAAARGDTALMQTLLAQGADVNATSPDNTPGLWSAVSSRRVSAVSLLLTRGADTEALSQFGQTPLEAAVENLSIDSGTEDAKADAAIIKLLLAKGADQAKIEQNAASVALLKSHGIKI